jgi:hypothetical protein
VSARTLRPPADVIVVALATVQGFSDGERQMMLDFVRQCYRAIGRPVTDLSAAFPALAGREFTWPEFDRWQAFFTARSRFPARWDGLQRVPRAGTPEAEAYQRRKLDLLFEWLDALARRSAVLAHYARRGLRARVARQDASAPCDVCARVGAHHDASGDDDAMPPFHPGCRCVVLAVHAVTGQPANRQPRSYPGVS